MSVFIFLYYIYIVYVYPIVSKRPEGHRTRLKRVGLIKNPIMEGRLVLNINLLENLHKINFY